MLALQNTVIICVIAFMLCTVTTTTQGQGELPVEISPVKIPSTSGECPSDDIRQESRSFLGNATREIIQNLNTLTNSISQNCGPGNWRRVFYLNASRSDQSCPGQWNLVTSPVRVCTGADYSCSSAFSDDVVTAYSKVCGRIIGENRGTTDGFNRSPTTIEGHYLDGVSVTHGASGSRTHIWSLGADHHSVVRCPCHDSNRDIPSPQIGDNYFCDRGDIDGQDRLWTGENCASDNPCCSFNSPPYFSVQLPAATADRIELRICINEPQANENVVVLFAEMYVQ
jgi:hypothetical protein